MYFLGWNPTIALRILFCVTRYGASGGRVHFLLRVFDSLLVGCVGVGRRQRQLATWRTFKKVDKANRYGASGCRRGSQLSATAGEEGRLFSGIAHNAATGGRERAIWSDDGGGRFRRRRAKSTEKRKGMDGRGEKRMRATAPSLPIRCGASAYGPAVAAASRRRRLWQLSPGEPRWMRSAPLGGRIVVWGHGWRNAVLPHCYVHFKSTGLLVDGMNLQKIKLNSVTRDLKSTHLSLSPAPPPLSFPSLPNGVQCELLLLLSENGASRSIARQPPCSLA